MGYTKEPWGFGIVRDGKNIAVEYTEAVARHWVDAEIVPLVPMKQRDDLLAALEYHQEQTRPIQATIDLIARVKGGAA